MKATRNRAVMGLALAIALAAAFLAATLGALAAAQPVGAQPAGRLHEQRRQRSAFAGSSLTMVKVVNTGSGNNAIAINGQTITYTIFITNNTGQIANNINAIDQLPTGSQIPASLLDQINCLTPCQPIFDSQQVPEPLGGSLLVTVTKQLSWTVASLAPQASTQLVFSARVVGQSDGTVFTNTAFATYGLSGSGPGIVVAPALATTVRVQVNQSGQPSLANAPTWFSSDLGGTLSQDWGDFNGDGQLDLALGSSLGVSVYLNQGGQLKHYWDNFASQRRAYGVRWADLNHDGKLEIVAVGDSLNGSAVTSGTTYIYGPVSGGFAQVGSFVTDYQMVRVAAGNFTGHSDGTIDLIASTNTLNANCPVELFVNDGKGNFTPSPNCVSHAATAALGPADVLNNGRLDLAVGVFPNAIEVLQNDGTGKFNNPALPPIVVDGNVPFLPYDFAWGDFDQNGNLDLAAAFPLQKEVRIYRNLGGSFLNDVPVIRTSKFLSPLSVAWGDLNGDGWLDLAVGDEIPRVYLNQQGQFDQSVQLAASPVSGQVWSLRSEQIDKSGNLNLSLTNRDGPSLLFNSFGGHLATTLQHFTGNSLPASSLALGDADGNGTIDVVLGAQDLLNQTTEIDHNDGAAFGSQQQVPSGPGPQSVAFGDVNGDGKLDVAVGTLFDARLYDGQSLISGGTTPAWTSTAPNGSNHIVAFCDVNSDGKLDLLVGSNGGGVAVYLNQGGSLSAAPSFTIPNVGNVTAIACADFQRNHYPGFAVAVDNQPVQLYQNNKDGTFTSVWNSGTHAPTTSLAWGDFNRDGYPDLAVGNFNQSTQIYENYQGVLQSQPIWTSPTQRRTTSLAWGDWNNDGLPDLAIGNDSQPTQVFANLGSTPGQPRLDWLWTSADSPQTTGVAWGDFSGDGHLDLAVSEKGNCSPCSGYYRNGLAPSHLNNNFIQTLTLPNNPSYLYVRRPGVTADGYGNSSSEVLGGPSQQTVTVAYTLYDANGSRALSNAAGNSIARTIFEYSLDGGSNWLTATAAAGWAGPVTTTFRLGQGGTFPWDIVKDKAISDDARFRVRIVPYVPVGPVQSSSAVAVSPPFIVRGVTCVWPQYPAITVSQNPISPTVPAGFFGSVLAGSGALTYTWNFGDSTGLTLGQIAQHTFNRNGIYTVTLTVSGQPCPQNRDVVASLAVQVGSGPGTNIYLPLVTNGAAAMDLAAPGSAATQPAPGITGAEHVRERPSGSAPPVGLPRGQAVAAPASVVPPTPGITVTTTTVGINNEPSLNGDGSRIAFWSTANPTGNNPDGSIEAFLIITDTGGVTITQITSSTGSILGGFNLSPSIDEAGDRVAFFSDRDLVGQNPDSSFQIFLYDVATQVLTQVTHTTKGFNILPSISANGQYIAFASDRDFVGANPNGDTQIFRAQILPGGGINFTQVTRTTGGVNDTPQINADGTRIAFVSDHNLDPLGTNSANLREVFLATIGPSGQVTFTQLTITTAGNTGEPSIDGDGHRVAFVSDQPLLPRSNNFREIFYADIDNAGHVNLTQVTNSQKDVGNDHPSISADGTRIAFISPDSVAQGQGLTRVYDTVLGAELRPSGVYAGLINDSLSGDGTVVGVAANNQLYLTFYRLARLRVTKTVSPGPIFQSQPFSYTVLLTNTGPSKAFNVVLTDTLGSIPGAHPGWNFLGDTLDGPPGSLCSTVTGTPIVCNLGTLLPRTTVTLTVSISATTYGPLTNTVSASSDTAQRIPADNPTLTVNVLPLPVAAVNLSLTGPNTGTALLNNTFIASVSPITASVPLTYTWRATNQADRVLTSNVFTDAEVYAWNPGGVQVVTVTVTNAALNVVTATQTITIFNPNPMLTSTSPITALVNSPPLALTLNGAGFVANSSVLWNNSPLNTTFVTGSLLTAIVPTADLTPTGIYTVAVLNPGPGGGQSGALPFLVEYPAPTITSLQPFTAARGGPAFTLNVNGSNFVNGASLFFGSQPSLTTFFNSDSLLTASIPASYLLSSGPVNITVTNPSPSVGPSNASTFTLFNPSLSLVINPNLLAIGQTATLTATISDVQAADRTITLASSNSTIASVPSSVVLPAGTTSVTATVTGVGNPGGVATITGTLPALIGGGFGTAQVTVNNPTPTIAQTNPVSATAGGPTFTFTITGSNYVSGATLYWGSQAPLSLSGTGGLVTASIPASYIASPGTVIITTTNPLPNSGASLPVSFDVISPTLSLSPSSLSLAAGATATITATISAPQAFDRIITIDETKNLLNNPPSTVTLPAGALSTTFTIKGKQGNTGVLTGTLPASLGGLFDTVLITVSNPVPQISLIVPSTISVSIPANLDITGSGFVPTSDVQWNGASLAQTGFVSSAEMTATVPATLFPVTGSYTVTIVNPTPGGGTSNGFSVTAVNPSPGLTNMSPTTASVNSPAFTLAVTGTNFVSGASNIYFNGQQQPTTFIDSGHLTATIGASNLLSPGDFPVVVSTTAPGGTSSPLTFTVVTVRPSIRSISPVTGTINSPSYTLIVSGTNFLNPPDPSGASVIQINNSPVATTFQTSGRLTAVISPTVNTPATGTYNITVLNPQPPGSGGLVSNAVPFTVTDPVPLLVSLSPTMTTMGSPTFTLTVNGDQFVSGDSVVQWAGVPLNTTFVSVQRLTAVVDPAKVATAGTFNVTVKTTPASPPGGGTSAALPFTVVTPTLSLAPSPPITIAVGANRALTATISGIQASDTVISLHSSNSAVATVSATVTLVAGQSQVSFPVTGVVTGTAVITAQLPSALGSGVSNPVTVTVNATGGFAPRFGPMRVLARLNRNRLFEVGGVPWLALIPPAAQSFGWSRRKKSNVGQGRT